MLVLKTAHERATGARERARMARGCEARWSAVPLLPTGAAATMEGAVVRQCVDVQRHQAANAGAGAAGAAAGGADAPCTDGLRMGALAAWLAGGSAGGAAAGGEGQRRRPHLVGGHAVTEYFRHTGRRGARLGELHARGAAGAPSPLDLPEAESAVLLQAYVVPVQATDLHLSLLVDLHRLVDPLARSGTRYAVLQRSTCPVRAEEFLHEVAGALGLSAPRAATARGAVAGLLEDLLYDGTAADAPATTASWRARHAPLCHGMAEPAAALGAGGAGQLPRVLAGFVLQLHSARAALLHANAGAVGAARAALRARPAAPEPVMAVATYLLLASAAHRVLTYAAAALEGEGLITADIRRGAVHVHDGVATSAHIG
jgi:hypothetical protein